MEVVYKYTILCKGRVHMWILLSWTEGEGHGINCSFMTTEGKTVFVFL